MHTLIDLFSSLENYSESIACVHRTEYRRFTYTYQDIIEGSKRVALWLQKRGLEKGDTVMIWGANGPEWIMSFWGTVLAGGIVVPIDFLALTQHVKNIEHLTSARFLFKSQFKPDPHTNASIIPLEHVSEYCTPNSHLSHFTYPDIVSDDIVEIIYTSGTTGDPKGVVMKHKNLVSNIMQTRDHIDIKQEWTFLSLLPMSHLFEQTGGFLVPFSKGCQIVYLSTLKPSAIFSALKKEQIHVVMMVPRLLQALKNGIESQLDKKHLFRVFSWLLQFARGKPQSTRKKIFHSIHKVFGSQFQFFVSGGSALSHNLETWWDTLGFTIIQGYGLSECAPVLATSQPDNIKQGSVGKALPDIDIRISPSGEILARGPNIFDGYYNDITRTQEVFTSDGWFKTGDVGILDEHEFLFIKGRIKDVIVTESGMNVYPEDIEAELVKIPGVLDASVVERDQTPFAILILSEGVNGSDVVSSANTRLNSAQQISGWVLWHEMEFPKTTTMKVKKAEINKWLDKQCETGTQKSFDTKIRKLYHLISRVTGVSASEISPKKLLVGDLKLSSIDRLELTSLIETEFYFELDESAITPETTVQDLECMIQKRKGKSSQKTFREWHQRNIFYHWRRFMHAIFVSQIVKYYCSPRIKGLEYLKDIPENVIFAPNHVSFLDHPSILTSLPDNIRYKVLTAARSEFFDEWSNPVEWFLKGFCFEFCTMILNVFPISQKSSFKSSLVHAGKMVDKGYSILMFPEGSRSWDGNLLEFKHGVTLLARELKIPVVPVKVGDFQNIFPRGSFWPKRGSAFVQFGKPIYYTHGESLADFTQRLKNTILNM